VDLRPKKVTGKQAEATLGEAHITVNKNAIPNDPEKPFVTSGVRIGSPAMTTRGFKDAEAVQVADFIADALESHGDAAALKRISAQVNDLCARFPVYGPKMWQTYGYEHSPSPLGERAGVRGA
jgi:glycine hydroxymethyltransferase